MADLGRLITAMVTPFDDRGEVDYRRAGKLALALLDSGSHGVLVSGTTGESPTLSHQEKLKLFAEVKSAVGDRGVVLAGTGSYDTAESARFTREAEDTGVDGCLMVVPYYNKPTPEGLYQHFKAIASNTSLPCILYNVPSRTITSLDPDTVIRLSRIDNIVAVKEASGNLDHIAEIIRGTGEDFLVYSGNDGDTLPIMALGGYGVISVASHLVGVQIRDMLEASLDGRTREAEAIHQSLAPLVSALFVVSNPTPVKYALARVGFPVGKPRLPLLEPDETAASAIDAALSGATIDLPAAVRN
ncbi:MAG: 4-hydroxy-tetrahydrodipicolinate synthase [Dehalococcoidia bacterium]